MTARGVLSLLPNIISLARLLAVPVTVYLILQSAFVPAFWLFVAAGISDALDGFLAKRLNAVSVIGEFLDPLADKALLVSVFIALGYRDHVAMWLVILIVFRDLLIIGGAILFQTLTHSLEVNPLYISKINTVAQIVLACAVLAQLASGWNAADATLALTIFVGVTTFLSGAAYVIKWGWMAVLMEREK
jgi:cardiolipin synthase (CMP-forming)